MKHTPTRQETLFDDELARFSMEKFFKMDFTKKW
jgi:hypothetical protein